MYLSSDLEKHLEWIFRFIMVLWWNHLCVIRRFIARTQLALAWVHADVIVICSVVLAVAATVVVAPVAAGTVAAVSVFTGISGHTTSIICKQRYLQYKLNRKLYLILATGARMPIITSL